jgi:hypothetical protein
LVQKPDQLDRLVQGFYEKIAFINQGRNWGWDIPMVEKSGNRRLYAPTFADAVARYGGMVNDDKLGEAYRRAENSFKGQLEQYFVVLKKDMLKASIAKKSRKKSALEMQERFPQTCVTARGRGRGKVWGKEKGRGLGSRGSGSTKSTRLLN